jgi:hypothetical protein
MIGKIFKYMSVFSLWIAGLALSAHMLIPHDHHLSDSLSNQDKSCSNSNNSNHKSGFPIHCHAFNDLASEKVRPVQITQNIQVSFVTFGIIINTSAFKLDASFISLPDFQKPVFDSFTLELSLLRAPPSLA